MRVFFLVCFLCAFLTIPVKAFNHRDSIDVLHYDLHIELMNTHNSFIKGMAILQCKTRFVGESLAFDLYKLNVDSVKVNNQHQNFESNDTIVRIFNAYNANDSVEVVIYYQGIPQKDKVWGGFFFQEGFAYNIGVGMGSYPPGIGRFWYPCIDSFTDRATYDYFVKTSVNNMGVAGGLLVDNWVEEGYRISHWRLNQDIPTYLSSIAVGPFIVIDSVYYGYDTIPLQLFSSQSDSAGLVNTFSQINETTQAFEKYFGAYRWDKLGFVVVPFNMGAMEHATNIAFPSNALSGSLGNKTLAAHELSHHWFGNLVTCASSQEMWLNEGWASYCEVIFKAEVFSKEIAQQQVVSNHNFVLKSAHKVDGGYYPLNQLPPEITYGKHAYDKGADIVHTLRNYLGDSLFFIGVNHYLNKFAYHHVTSQDLCDALSESTDEDLQDFFNNWVYQAGFPHYAVDSFSSSMFSENEYKVTIALKQKLNAREEYSQRNRIELTFANDEWDFVSQKVEFNEVEQSVEVIIPFEPKVVFVDLEKKCADATIDQYSIVNKTGYTLFNDCDFKLNVSELNDSAFIQVIHNFALADNPRKGIPGVHVSDYHYWSIIGLLPELFTAEGSFFYNFSSNTNPDDGYVPTANDTIVLLYREHAGRAWNVIFKGGSAKIPIGELNNVPIQMGEYAIGFWDGTPMNSMLQPSLIPKNKCYPIPTTNRCNIEFENTFSGKIAVYNNIGCKIADKKYSKVDSVLLNTEYWLAGIYYIKVEGNQNEVHRIVKN